MFGDTEITGATVTPELVTDTSAHPAFTAVARTDTGTPTSADTNVYVLAVAPWIAVPSRNHWNDHESGATVADGFAVNT